MRVAKAGDADGEPEQSGDLPPFFLVLVQLDKTVSHMVGELLGHALAVGEQRVDLPLDRDPVRQKHRDGGLRAADPLTALVDALVLDRR